MFGLSTRELRFGLLVSSSHFSQHFLSRLIPPLIPVLAVALAYPLWKLGLLISVYSLGSGLAQAPLGVASDRYDRVYILPTGIGLAGVGYVVFSAAPVVGAAIPGVTLPWLAFDGAFFVMLFAMLLTGVGTAVTHPVGYPLITDNVDEGNKGKILGAFGSSSKFGDAAAPAAVAVLLVTLAWSDILAVLGVAGIAYATFLFWALRSDEFVTVPAAVTDEAEDDDEEAAGGRSIWEVDRRTYLYPMLVVYAFFITRKFSANGLQTFFAAFFVGVYAYSFQFQDVSMGPATVANAYFSALFIFGAISQLGFGGLTDRIDARVVLVGCLSLATAGFLLLGTLQLGPLALLAVLLALGVGLWGLNPARDALISEITPPEREGRTFGYIWTAVQMSGVVIPPLVGYLMEVLGLQAGFLLLSIGTALGAISLSTLFSDRVYREATRGPGRPAASD